MPFQPTVSFKLHKKKIPLGGGTKRHLDIAYPGSYLRFFINNNPVALGHQVSPESEYELTENIETFNFKIPVNIPSNVTLTWKFIQAFGGDYVELTELIGMSLFPFGGF